MIFTIPSQSRNADQWQKLCQLKKKKKKTSTKLNIFFIDVQVLSLIEFLFWNFLSTLN